MTIFAAIILLVAVIWFVQFIELFKKRDKNAQADPEAVRVGLWQIGYIILSFILALALFLQGILA